MAKYKIWDKQSTVITPSGEVFTADQWKQRYPATQIDGIDYIIGGGVINGCVMMEYTSTIERYEAMGVDFTGCNTKQDYLDEIEAWENAPVTVEETTSTDVRIADALEDLVVLQMPDV